MTDRPRVVLDTNIFVSAFLSRNPSSPTRELIELWKQGAFTVVISDTLANEVLEKLFHKKIEPARVAGFALLLDLLAEWVEVPAAAVEAFVPADPDDDHVVACALVGGASYLVTYDAHFDALARNPEQLQILKPLPFLRQVRGDKVLPQG